MFRFKSCAIYVIVVFLCCAHVSLAQFGGIGLGYNPYGYGYGYGIGIGNYGTGYGLLSGPGSSYYGYPGYNGYYPPYPGYAGYPGYGGIYGGARYPYYGGYPNNNNGLNTAFASTSGGVATAQVSSGGYYG